MRTTEKYFPLDSSESSLQPSHDGESEDSYDGESFNVLRYHPLSRYRCHILVVSHIALVAINVLLCIGYTLWVTSWYSHGMQHARCRLDVPLGTACQVLINAGSASQRFY
jgi:hypothetical protein